MEDDSAEVGSVRMIQDMEVRTVDGRDYRLNRGTLEVHTLYGWITSAWSGYVTNALNGCPRHSDNDLDTAWINALVEAFA